MTLDDWKQTTPEEFYGEDMEHNCSFCGAPIYEGRYCNSNCRIAEQND